MYNGKLTHDISRSLTSLNWICLHPRYDQALYWTRWRDNNLVMSFSRRLFRKRRKHRDPESVVNAWEWKTVPEHELLEITIPDMVKEAVIYPLHTPLELRPMSREQLLKLKEENAQLKLVVAR